ncbi:MAG: aspartate carbamoyltransferase regulatory subunit, partial [Lachnospiraceae bacterium]|nr:aspartate carbamoyltransferase regulatory subunit [Lachnospiraceae bacterium]
MPDENRKQYKLYVGKIEEGFVIDHITPGNGMRLYYDLGLDHLECSVAIILNAFSRKMGKKDMIKVEMPLRKYDLDIIAFLDRNATVDIIQNGEIIDRPKMELPKKIRNVIKCHNPRCITSIEQELEHIFLLTDPSKGTYRCKYCETEWKESRS